MHDKVSQYEKEERWYHKITVEPTMFLYMFSFMLTSVVEQAFFLYKACLVNHNLNATICDHLEDYKEIKKEVQITASNFHQYDNIAAHIFPIILALFLGAWSDKRGRKFPLLMGLTGKLIYSLMIIVNANQPTWPVEYIIFTATIPCALSGADVAIFASCFAYISDVSTVENRTIRVTILDICYLFTMPTGVALGSYLFNYVLDRSYSKMFAINASLMFLSIVYSLIVLKWQTTSKQRSLRELGCCGIFGDFFDIRHVKASFKVLCKKREMHRRLFLLILLLTMALYTFVRDEKAFLYLYTQLIYDWNVEHFSNYKTFQSSAYVITMLIALPIMTKVLKWRDTVIILIGCSAHAIARIIYIFSYYPWLFYLASAVCSLGPIVGPVLRSMTSKIVPISERGKVFALLSVCDNAVPFISGVLYAQVYNATLGEMGSIFLLSFAAMVGVFILTLTIHCILGERTLSVPEEDITTNPINVEDNKEIIEKC